MKGWVDLLFPALCPHLVYKATSSSPAMWYVGYRFLPGSGYRDQRQDLAELEASSDTQGLMERTW